jgi:hypothetical protein
MAKGIGKMWEVLKTAKKVSEKSEQVHIDKKALVNFSERLCSKSIGVPQWDNFYHFFNNTEDTVSYLLVLDSLNFCFWAPSRQSRWQIEYQSQRLSGYYGLAAALKRAFESGIPITEAEYLAQLSVGELKQVLGGQGQLQLMQQRAQILNEVGRVLLTRYEGKSRVLVESAAGSAIRLVRLLADHLSSFADTTTYGTDRVYFYKRAQIFAADLYGAFAGGKWGGFSDIDRLTAFADYKLPQVLRHLRIFRYEHTLARKVDQQVCLSAGSPEEVEIRANTIWAVELIRQNLARMGRPLKAFEVDSILWNLGQASEYRARPYHRTLTVFY